MAGGKLRGHSADTKSCTTYECSVRQGVQVCGLRILRKELKKNITLSSNRYPVDL
jgi:hypothetical protein